MHWRMGPRRSRTTTPLRTAQDAEPVEHEGCYYAIAYTITDTRDALGVTAGIDYDPRRTDGPAVTYGGPPARDRALLDSLVLPGRSAASTAGTWGQ
jgi:hypothetical protein